MKNYDKTLRQIRVFISSSFRDMTAERDYLRDYIFPVIREKAAMRGVAVTALDLRWGIPDGTDLAETIEICLSEIDNSYPFFIGFIGSEYGTQPASEIYENSENLKERFHSIQNYFTNRLSITDMEMRYGVIDNSETKLKSLNALFFVRAANLSVIDRHPLSHQLKSDIESLADKYVENVEIELYNSLKQMGDRVLVTFDRILDAYFPISDGVTPADIERFHREATISELIRFYVPNLRELTEISDFVNGHTPHVLHITGETGTGKSALLAYYIHINQHKFKEQGIELFYRFVGHDPKIVSSDILETQFTEEIIACFGITLTPGAKLPAVSELLNRPEIKSKRLLFVIDDVSRMLNADNMFWLPTKLPNVKVILSSDTKFAFPKNIYGNNATLELNGLFNKESRQELIQKYIYNFHRRRLVSDNIRTILDWQMSSNPLALMTLLEELMSIGKFNSMDSIISHYTKSCNLQELLRCIVERYISTPNYEWVKDALGLITASLHGLSEHQIIELIGVPQIFWSGFFCSFRRHFFIRNGHISIGSNAMREAIKSFFTDDEYTECHSRLLPLFINPKNDREAEEFMLHTYCTGIYTTETFRFMSNPMIFSHLYQWEPQRVDIMWQNLYSLGYSPDALIIDSNDYDQQAESQTYANISNYYGQYVIQVLQLLNYMHLDKPALTMFDNYKKWGDEYGITAMDYIPVYSNVGGVCMSAGHFNKALEVFKEGFLMFSNEPGALFVRGYHDNLTPFDFGPGFWSWRFHDMAECCRLMGDYDNALTFYDKALDDCEDLLEIENSSTNIALIKSIYLHKCMAIQAKFGLDMSDRKLMDPEALQCLNKAYDLRFSDDEQENYRLLLRFLGYKFIADVMMANFQYVTANSYYNKTIEQHNKSDWHAHNSLIMATDFYNYALSFFKCGYQKETLSCLESALEYLKGYPEGYLHSKIYTLMSDYYNASGQSAIAKVYSIKAADLFQY